MYTKIIQLLNEPFSNFKIGQLIKKEIEKSSDINEQCPKTGNTLLHQLIAKKGTTVSLLKKLLDNEAVQKPNNHNQYPLHIAATHKDTNFAKLLLKHTPNGIISQDKLNAKTPLDYALDFKHYEIVACLIKAINDGKELGQLTVKPNNKNELDTLRKKNTKIRNAYIYHAVKAVKYENGNLLNENLLNEYLQLSIEEDTPQEVAIIFAIKLKKIELFKSFVEKSESQKITDNLSLYILKAVKNGALEILQYLCNKYTFNLDGIKNSLDRNPPLIAAKIRKIKNKYDYNALLLAAAHGHTETVEFLLNSGFSKDAKINNGLNALLLAAAHGHTETVEFLLNSGFSKDAKTNDGRNALLLAAAHGHTETVEFLLNSKFSFSKDTTDKDGLNALLLAAGYGHTKTVEFLLNYGFSEDATDNFGYNALLLAAANSHTGTVKFLLNYGFSKNAKTNSGRNALLLAAAHGHTETVEFLLLNSKFLKNATDNFGYNALLLTAANGHTKTVEFLLNFGFSEDAKTNDGRNTLLLAAINGRTKTVEFLLNYGFLFSENDTDKYGLNALLLAAAYGHTGTVKFLLNFGFSEDATDNFGYNALLLAAAYGHTGAVEFLLNFGFSKDTTDKNGCNALLLATAYGYIGTVKFLLRNFEFSENDTDKYGRNTLLLAAVHGFIEIVKFLIKEQKFSLVVFNDIKNFNKIQKQEISIYVFCENFSAFLKKNYQNAIDWSEKIIRNSDFQLKNLLCSCRTLIKLDKHLIDLDLPKEKKDSFHNFILKHETIDNEIKNSINTTITQIKFGEIIGKKTPIKTKIASAFDIYCLLKDHQEKDVLPLKNCIIKILKGNDKIELNSNERRPYLWLFKNYQELMKLIVKKATINDKSGRKILEQIDSRVVEGNKQKELLIANMEYIIEKANIGELGQELLSHTNFRLNTIHKKMSHTLFNAQGNQQIKPRNRTRVRSFSL